MKRKFLIILLALVCALCCAVMFSACADKNQPDQSVGGTQTEQSGSNNGNAGNTGNSGNSDDNKNSEINQQENSSNSEQEGTQHTHDWGEWIEITPATCVKEGEELRICKLDSAHTETRKIASNPTAHHFEHIEAKMSTCLEKGWEEHDECEYCGYSENKVELDYSSHKYNKNNICDVCGTQLQYTKNLEYVLNIQNNTYTVAGKGSATDKDIIIPYFYNDLPVVAIGEKAFYYSDITSAIMPSTIISIGRSAFEGCSNIINIILNVSENDKLNDNISSIIGKGVISLSKNITDIGYQAFANCFNLENVALPNNVVNIEDNVFFNCKNIKTAQIPSVAVQHITKNSLKVLNVTGGEIIVANACDNCSTLERVTLADTLIAIGDSAFENCSSLTRITIPDSVTSIGDSAFRDCISLESITLGDNITIIGGAAFYGCCNLTNITLPKSIINIGDSAFRGCWKLEIINLSETRISSISQGYFLHQTKSPLNSLIKTLDNGLIFYEGDSVYLVGYIGNQTELTLPEKFNSKNYDIYQYAFYNNKNITSIIIPEGVTTIGDYAFSDCTSLESITISDSVTSIGDSAFSNCVALESVIIPNSVTTISNHAFSDCTSIEKVTIGNSVISIGKSAFYSCYKLFEVINLSNLPIKLGESSYGYVAYYALNLNSTAQHKIKKQNDYIFYEDGKTVYLLGYTGKQSEPILPEKFNGKNYDIYKYAFYNNKYITNIDIPDSVMSIGDSAFRDCTSLESVTISDSITSIGEYVFRDCTSLKSITIPNNVISMGVGTFYNCKSLESATIGNGITTISSNAFYDCTGLKNIVIGNNITKIGSYAFCGCTNLYSIIIPYNVTTISTYAFSDCYKLLEVVNLSKLPISNTSFTSDYGGIGEYALAIYKSTNFSSKIKIKDDYVFYDDGVDVYLVDYIGNKTEIVLPNKFNGKNYKIYKYAFANCEILTGITLSDSVTEIGGCAFYNCISLKNINISNSVTEIKYRAFLGCTSLKNVTIPDNVIEIGISTFENCTSLESVTIGNGIRNIRMLMFSGCTNLKDIIIGTNVITIERTAFDNCTSLASVTFKNIYNWKISEDNKMTNAQSVDVSNSAQNAVYVRRYYMKQG